MPTHLSDPTTQDLFVNDVPNALAPNYIYSSYEGDETNDDNSNHNNVDDGKAKKSDSYSIAIQQATHVTGLKDQNNKLLNTPIWGYGQKSKKSNAITVTWPGKTFEVQSYQTTVVTWENELFDAYKKPLPHLFGLDDTLHWCYALPDRERNLETDGIPLVPHLHGGHTDSDFDGNPEYFEGLTRNSQGPRFVSNIYNYDNSQRAGTLWYHDHALGLTRLNVNAGLVGFYIIRDQYDTGKINNPLSLPANKFELAYCVQDRVFRTTGEIYFPAYKIDQPVWDDFIHDGVNLPDGIIDGPSVLTEFFGDHIVVNGKIWPKTNVEPRLYRLRLLNGCDSRFMRIQFRSVPLGDTDLKNASAPLNFTVIGSDQGFLQRSTVVTKLDFIPAERLDILFDFSSVPKNSRVIIENLIGDTPFKFNEYQQDVDNGDLVADPLRRTDRIMAFDVTLALSKEYQGEDSQNNESNNSNNNNNDNNGNEDKGDKGDKGDKVKLLPFNKINFDKLISKYYKFNYPAAVKTRKLGLFEATDEFGRLMPLLGTAEKIDDVYGNEADGSLTWDHPITENPKLGATEIWEFYNVTEDAHPIHVHLVEFEIMSRNDITFTLDDTQPFPANSTHVDGKAIVFDSPPVIGDPRPVLETEKGPKDMVLCYPGQVTRIRLTFDKPGRYVWHCHILSHEDHEMMRPIHVGDGPF